MKNYINRFISHYMPKKLIKRFLPDHSKIRDHKHLRVFGSLIHDPNLWHLNRRSVAGAMSVGLFAAFIPVPFQMVIAAAMAIPARVNLPISVALVWVTNPFTMPPLFYFAYKVGVWVLSIPPKPFYFELSFQWLAGELGTVWRPFLLGCFIMGVVSGGIGNLFIRGLWRLYVIRYLRRRRRAALARAQDNERQRP